MGEVGRTRRRGTDRARGRCPADRSRYWDGAADEGERPQSVRQPVVLRDKTVRRCGRPSTLADVTTSAPRWGSVTVDCLDPEQMAQFWPGYSARRCVGAGSSTSTCTRSREDRCSRSSGSRPRRLGHGSHAGVVRSSTAVRPRAAELRTTVRLEADFDGGRRAVIAAMSPAAARALCRGVQNRSSRRSGLRPALAALRGGGVAPPLGAPGGVMMTPHRNGTLLEDKAVEFWARSANGGGELAGPASGAEIAEASSSGRKGGVGRNGAVPPSGTAGPRNATTARGPASEACTSRATGGAVPRRRPWGGRRRAARP